MSKTIDLNKARRQRITNRKDSIKRRSKVSPSRETDLNLNTLKELNKALCEAQKIFIKLSKAYIAKKSGNYSLSRKFLSKKISEIQKILTKLDNIKDKV